MNNAEAGALRTRIRRWTAFFMFGLVISGLTAIPIATEVAIAESLLGSDFTAGGRLPDAVASWLRTVRDAVTKADTEAPLLFYGTDWLAFGHVAIAIAFIGALRDPVRNRWLFRFGMIACALVPLWALVFGAARGIPGWWRVIDSAFGVLGFVPMWLCDRWAGRLEAAAPPFRNG